MASVKNPNTIPGEHPDNVFENRSNIVSVECPNCGGQVQRKENDYFGVCPYCGTEIAFDEIREEAQLTGYRERLDKLELDSSIDSANKQTLLKWLRIRNICFIVLAICTFLGFAFAGCPAAEEQEFYVGVGAILMLIAGVILIGAIPYISSNYPEYNILRGKIEKGAKLKMYITLMLTAIGVCLVAAFLAYLAVSALE